MDSDTIFALSSGAGRAGVAVIRVSGPASRIIAEALLGSVPAPRQARLRHIRTPRNGEVIDQALALYFQAPHSFTGEDVLELQVHGSPAVTRVLLRILGEFPNCRPAKNGEFTRRAFDHGRMDVLDVEALADVLTAETETQRRLAIQMPNAMRRLYADWRDRLLTIRAITEAYIDFSDEDDVASRIDSQTERELAQLLEDLCAFARTEEHGQRIREGFRIALAGPPNSGKSSLLNALARRDIAIVSSIPGTTRDVIEASIDLDGLAVIVADSAGLREAQDPIEAEGIARARRWAESADLVLWTNPVDSPAECPNGQYLEVRTKADLVPDSIGLKVSVQAPNGLDALVKELGRRLNAKAGYGDMPLMANARQASAVRRAAGHLERAVNAETRSLELRAEELRLAGGVLEELTGRIDQDAVFDAIFSKFCIGK